MNDAITAVMTLYFDGLYHSDVARLRRVFHEKAIYACATESALIYKTMEEYFPIVAARPSPASMNQQRADAVVNIDNVGDSMAFVKAHCAIGPKYFTDFLTFVKADGQWRILSKIFHFEMRPTY
jgi:hypothetical protein